MLKSTLQQDQNLIFFVNSVPTQSPNSPLPPNSPLLTEEPVTQDEDWERRI